jgi:hypothetical protein
MPNVVTEHTQPKLPPRPTVFEAPQEIVDRVARELDGYSEEAKQRTLTYWTLGYYFRDMPAVPVAYRSHPKGVEVLALGLEEVTAFRKDMPLEEQRKYTFGQTP